MNNRFFRFLLRKEGAILLVVALVSFFIYHDISKPGLYSSLDDYYSQSAKWDTCYDTFECLTYDVPIDYSDLNVGTFQISALRYPAQDRKNRIGSLIVNPGGPGASGVDYAYNAEYIFDPDLTDRYDIVGFDPRGVSRSAPITCFNDQETDANYASDSKPDNSAEFKAAVAESKKFIQKCFNKNQHLESFSTANAARDMDILRALVGDKKLNYMGKSYGTYMGALYATLFPNNIGRVILDGAVDPHISNLEQTKTQAVGFDDALQAFIADCIKLSSCPLPRNQKDATAKLLSIWQGAATEPLPLKNKNDRRTVTESLLVLGTASALYDSAEGWPELRKAIGEAIAGYGDTYLELADMYTGRQADGTYPNNEFDSGAIIDCLDFKDSRTPAQIRSDAAKVAAAAPVFGPYIAYSGLTCKYFSIPDPVEVVTTKTNAPILIIGTTGDPATPYEWAKGLAGLLPNSRVLTFVGDGHTGQGRGNACIDDAVDAYFLTGALPAAELRCTA
jgi:pimeloyl-ACP methyl ester carboxylesterase